MESTNQSKNFKRRIASLCSLGMVILLVVGFSGCSNKKTNSNETDNETTTKNGSNTKDDDYELLDEFIEFISNYSDKPDDLGSQEEYDAFYKEQYDNWRTGEEFSNIVIDENNHIAFADHVEKFTGDWEDTWSQRCSMEIDAGPHTYQIYIKWASSATEVTRWYFTGNYDSKTGRILYTGDCIVKRYTEDGEEEQETIYENGTGSFYIIDGLLHWDDDIDEQSTNCVFEKNNN